MPTFLLKKILTGKQNLRCFASLIICPTPFHLDFYFITFWKSLCSLHNDVCRKIYCIFFFLKKILSLLMNIEVYVKVRNVFIKGIYCLDIYTYNHLCFLLFMNNHLRFCRLSKLGRYLPENISSTMHSSKYGLPLHLMIKHVLMASPY